MFNSIHGMTLCLSKDKKVLTQTRSHVINPINMTLRSRVNVVSGSLMYAPHCLMMIDPCAKLICPIIKIKGSYGSNTKTLIFVLEVKGQRLIGIMKTTQHVVSKWYTMCQICHSYGPETNLDRQRTDAQTDRENDSYIPPNLRWRGCDKLNLGTKRW